MPAYQGSDPMIADRRLARFYLSLVWATCQRWVSTS
jgi:hypothetical protein